MKKLYFLAIMVLVSTIFYGCKKDKEDPTAPTYTNGQGEIGKLGGTITIEDEDSPLNGTTLIIPSDALDNSVEIKIKNATGEIFMPGDSNAYIIKLEPAGLEFKEPVSIAFPVLSNGNVSKIKAWNILPDDQELHQLPAYFDSQQNKIIATTSHFSYFAISENGVYANTNMKYFKSDKTLLVNFSVNSWSFGNYYRLGGIPSKIWSWPFGIFNAKQIIDKGAQLSGSWVISYLNLELKKKNNYWFDPTIAEKKILVKRIGDINDGYGASVYEENLLGDNFKYGSSIMSSDFRESFFSGEAIVFSFPNIELDDDSKYYIKAKWGIVGDVNASIIGGRYTDLYTINSIDYAKMPDDMDDTGFSDQNNNFVDEAYEETVPNDPPIASFVASTTNGTIPLSVQFTDQSSNNPTIWHWEFGDGFTSSEKNPTHTYNSSGAYSVKLIVENTYGSDTEFKENFIHVNQSGSAPVANFSANNTSGPAPLTVSFTDQSTNNPTTWQWDFGDGGTSTQPNPSHTYNIDGSYTVSLFVNNNYGSDTKTILNYIEVENTSNNPIANYPFAGNALDVSGNELNGTIFNAVLTSDRNGASANAFYFDGDEDYITVENNSLLQAQPGKPFTWCFWIKPESSNHVILCKGKNGSSGAYFDYWLELTSENHIKFKYSFANINGQSHFESAQSIPLNEWSFIAITYTFGTGSSMHMYINGYAVDGSWVQGDGNHNPYSSNEKLYIGKQYLYTGTQGPYSYFNGKIDDIKIYDSILSASEIFVLFEE